MHAYRSHNCVELTEADVGQQVKLSGWINRKRDHGQLVFVDLRDHYGLTQCVADSSDTSFALVEAARLESVVTVTGTVLKRSDETINTSLPTGQIEVRIEDFEVQSAADTLPLQVNSDEDSGEETRLRYRYLDLRRARPHANIMLRAKIIGGCCGTSPAHVAAITAALEVTPKRLFDEVAMTAALGTAWADVKINNAGGDNRRGRRGRRRSS